MIRISNIHEVLEHIADLKGVIFDLDDTLYSEKQYVRSGYREIAKTLSDVKDAEKRWWQLFEEGKPAIDELLSENGIDSENKKAECLRVYRYQRPNITLYPGVENILETLRVSGYKLGVITDGRVEGQQAKIEALNLRKYFEDIIITDSLGGIQYRKPCEKAFEIMQERWQIPFSKMMYVGDNISKDFNAPEILGMKSCFFVNADGLYNQDSKNLDKR